MLEKKPSAGVYDFDFSPGEHPKLALFDTAPSGCNLGEPLVKAFWLPWESGATIGLELDTQAEYFLTAHMGGCQLRIIPAAGGAHTKVLHIAGNMSISDNPDQHPGGEKGGRRPKGTEKPGWGPKGTAWREEQAKKALTTAELGRSRAFSSTKTYPIGYGYSTPKEEEEKGLDVQVVGFKRRPRIFLARGGRQFLGTGAAQPRSFKIEFPWEFWAQQSGDEEDFFSVSRVWNILGPRAKVSRITALAARKKL